MGVKFEGVLLVPFFFTRISYSAIIWSLKVPNRQKGCPTRSYKVFKRQMMLPFYHAGGEGKGHDRNRADEHQVACPAQYCNLRRKYVTGREGRNMHNAALLFQAVTSVVKAPCPYSVPYITRARVVHPQIPFIWYGYRHKIRFYLSDCDRTSLLHKTSPQRFG